MIEIPYSQVQFNLGHRLRFLFTEELIAVDVYFFHIKNNIIYGTAHNKKGELLYLEGDKDTPPKNLKNIFIIN